MVGPELSFQPRPGAGPASVESHSRIRSAEARHGTYGTGWRRRSTPARRATRGITDRLNARTERRGPPAPRPDRTAGSGTCRRGRPSVLARMTNQITAIQFSGRSAFIETRGDAAGSGADAQGVHHFPGGRRGLRLRALPGRRCSVMTQTGRGTSAPPRAGGTTAWRECVRTPPALRSGSSCRYGQRCHTPFGPPRPQQAVSFRSAPTRRRRGGPRGMITTGNQSRRAGNAAEKASSVRPSAPTARQCRWCRRPAVGTDRLLRPRASVGAPAPAVQLKSRPAGPLTCPATPDTMPTKPGRRTPDDRRIADRPVTLPTKPPISICLFDDAVNRSLNNGSTPTRRDSPIAHTPPAPGTRHQAEPAVERASTPESATAPPTEPRMLV